MALQADQVGSFATIAVIPPGNSVRLNATVKPTGWVKLAIRLYGSREDLPGYSFEDTDRLVGDDLGMQVTWGGKAEIPHGDTPLMLRFQLKQTKLFGVEFCDHPPIVS